MAVQILMPKLGLTMKTGTVVKWLKEEGDKVKAKEPVLEIETEKLSYQIESPADGVLLKKLAAVGEKYPISFVVGYIGQPGEKMPNAPAGQSVGRGFPDAPVTTILSLEETSSKSHGDSSRETAGDLEEKEPGNAGRYAADGGRVFISPVARKLAAELGVDFKRVRGTGPNGRIVKADVQKYAETRGAATGASASDDDIIIPYTGMRRAIGENMLQAWSTIPMVTHHVTADVGALLEYRVMLNKGVDKNEQVSINDLILKLTAAALEKMPIINSSLTEEGIVLHKRIHLGMATALDNGLIVPVIRDANRKNLLALSMEAKDLATRARNGSLGFDEIRGATFTVSNLGGCGSVDYFTPIINPPEAAILGIGRIIDTAVPINGDIKIRPMMGLSFTYDHRIIDGAVAAGFIKTLMQLLENPARAVL